MPAAPPILGSTGSTTFVLAALLVALGIAMLVAAAWLTRATRTDVPALAPLEVMGGRRFVRRDADARAAVLAGVRPEGALGPAPMVEIVDPDADDDPETPEPEPPVDEEPAAAAHPELEGEAVEMDEAVVEAVPGPDVVEAPVVAQEVHRPAEDSPVADSEIVAEPVSGEETTPVERSVGDEDAAADSEAAESAPWAH